MGLLNRIKCCGEPPSARLIPRLRWISSCPANAICTSSAVSIWAPATCAPPAKLLKNTPADALIVEADISGNETPFSDLPTYPPLAERLSDAQLSELEARTGELGLSVGLFDSQPLWQVAMVLQATRAQKLGLRPDYGIDYQLLMAARESNIAVMELEGADSQIALLRDLPDGDGAAGGYADPLAHQRPFTAGHDRLVAGATAVARRGIAADDL